MNNPLSYCRDWERLNGWNYICIDTDASIGIDADTEYLGTWPNPPYNIKIGTLTQSRKASICASLFEIQVIVTIRLLLDYI